MYRLVLGPLVLALLAAVAGCRGGPPPREFEIVGQIQALAPERGEVTVKHQDIKGFMPGMTMTFKAASGVLDGRQPGDLVTGTLVVGEVDVHISKLTVTGHRDVDPTTVLPADGSAIIQPGDPVKVVFGGPGFAVSTEGKALSVAIEGQTAQVALTGGRVLSGIARAGKVVEIK